MGHEVKMFLMITGFDESPNVITDYLEIQPTRTWVQGEAIQNTLLRSKKNGWELSSGVEASGSFEEHLNALARMILTKRDRLRDLCLKYEGQIWCEIFGGEYSQQGFLQLYMSKESIRLFGEIGIEVNCEVYP